VNAPQLPEGIVSDLQSRLDYAEAVAEWVLDLSEEQFARADWEGALQYTRIAATILSRQNRTLSSARVEANLQRVAAHLARGDETRLGDVKPRETCLHVLTEALPTGGLIAISMRWMLNDRRGRRHSVALLDQRTPITEELAQLVQEKGGALHVADPNASLLSRARWLRTLACAEASHVVLNVDTADVIWGAAFGCPGGPPVMLVNQNAHLYWTGGSLIDLLLNIRGSALEGHWASVFRGISRYANVPIPLTEPSANGKPAAAAQRRAEARRLLGLTPEAVVLLTVGSWFKFLPLEDLDFVATCESILREVPQAVVLAVGFAGDERWNSASARVDSRIRTLGRVSQAELATLHAAADVYLEGFPFGTTTSLLEAALRGLPVVLAPATSPPPYGTDGLALDDLLVRPASASAYASTVIRLARSPADREREGEAVRNSVLGHHAGDGWRRHLEAALSALPAEHEVHLPTTPVRTPAAVHEYWSKFQMQWSSGFEHTLENALQHAYSLRLKPRLSSRMMEACRRAKALRSGQTIPLPLLGLLCNHILVRLPGGLNGRVFRLAAMACRGAPLTRVLRRLARLLRLTEAPRAPYQEYRSESAQVR
jgi:glycosyltransferase involved in cell wall biosynthesis